MLLDLIEVKTMYQDRLREAEQERFARQMRKQRPAAQRVNYLRPLLASVGDAHRMADICRAYRPGSIYHAAAYKHVPLVESNPKEGIENNVFGTLNMATVAQDHGVESFVLVSTDKAVRPTNVMGASKRMAELVLQALQERFGGAGTCFSMVRFGNVLGSSGSVVPLFRAQMARGGPLTVTHPEVTRYFMTIPEAAQLVLQAAAMACGGEVFVLDMGEPVKIIDLASDLIRLSGFEPGTDIDIVFSGIRPGEKLFEELLTAEEGTEASRFKKIFVARNNGLPAELPELLGTCDRICTLSAGRITGEVPAGEATQEGLMALMTMERESRT